MAPTDAEEAGHFGDNSVLRARIAVLHQLFPDAVRNGKVDLKALGVLLGEDACTQPEPSPRVYDLSMSAEQRPQQTSAISPPSSHLSREILHEINNIVAIMLSSQRLLTRCRTRSEIDGEPLEIVILLERSISASVERLKRLISPKGSAALPCA